MKIRVHRVLPQTKVAGPGLRFCIWVQGCHRHCKGCMMPETWSFDGGKWLEIEELFLRVMQIEGITGITFLGGEPFEQSQAVCELAAMLRAEGLSVLVFTGYQYEELLEKQEAGIGELLQNIDLLIDGAFAQEKFDLSRPWIGSSNQRYHFLSGRYCENDLIGVKNMIEARVYENGAVLFNGMGDFSKLKKIAL